MDKDMFRLCFSAPKMSADGEEAEIRLYGEIISNMPENWKFDKEDKSASDFLNVIRQAQEGGAKRLTLRINSPGGIVSEAVAMRSVLNTAGFDSITIFIEGICASAATLVSTLPGAKVKIAEGSDFMIHNPHCGAYGTAAELESAVQSLRNTEASARGMYMKRTGQDEETIKGWMDKETWFTAREAVANGFCDEVIAETDEPEIAMTAAIPPRTMAVMRAMYAHVPEGLEARTKEDSHAETEVATETAAEHKNTQTSEEDNEKMDITKLTREELESGNPELYRSVMKAAAEEERARMQEIDELTPAGYEDMAKKAKETGMSAFDYHKAVIRAQREKGEAFMNSRQKETEKAAEIKGGESGAEAKGEKAQMDAFAREMAGYAKGAGAGLGMY